MINDKMDEETCEITIKSKILDKLKLPNHYIFYKSTNSIGSINIIPKYYFEYLLHTPHSFNHYYLDVCLINISNYNVKKNEQLCIIITKFENKELFGFLWSIRPGRDIIVPYVYPKTYRDFLKKPRAVSLLITSSMLIDIEYRGEYLRWNPTVIILPEKTT